MEHREILLSLTEVTKRFARITVLDRISFNVYSGETVALTGYNGSGKSTLLRIIGGITPVSYGVIRREAIRTIGYAPDRFPKLKYTSVEYLTFMGNIQGIPNDTLQQRIRELHEWFRLPRSSNRIVNFSKGMLQKVNLMQALLSSPDLLLLDEPLSGLDVGTQGELLDVLRRLQSEGTAIVVATHEEEIIHHLADRNIHLQHGRIVGAAEAAAGKAQQKRIICSGPYEALVGLSSENGVVEHQVDHEQGRYVVSGAYADRFILKAIQAGASIAEVTSLAAAKEENVSDAHPPS